MNIIFMGTPDFAVPALKVLYEKHNVLAVFTQTDKPKGRGYKLVPPPVKELALQHGTEVLQPKSLKKDGEEYVARIKELAPDCIVVAAYGKILPKSVLDIPKLGCVNIHGSLLPKYRGAAPIQRAVLEGEKYSGITTMLMAEGLDTGDMLETAKTEIGENETASELFDRLSVLGAELIVHTLDELEKGNLVPEKQDDSKATYAAMLSKEMCPIDFSDTVQNVHNKIRGLSDWPCATATLAGKRLKIYHSEIASRKPTGKKPGSVVDAKKFEIACADGSIRFTEVQAEGSKRMSAADYLRGRPLSGDEILEG
ncbi:MAG: methionyl-tRNA formyltransferase [Ruminococcus sp.]|nr:methionyl-tRNA formyltransferase [Ruminococcus sp.]